MKYGIPIVLILWFLPVNASGCFVLKGPYKELGRLLYKYKNMKTYREIRKKRLRSFLLRSKRGFYSLSKKCQRVGVVTIQKNTHTLIKIKQSSTQKGDWIHSCYREFWFSSDSITLTRGCTRQHTKTGVLLEEDIGGSLCPPSFLYLEITPHVLRAIYYRSMLSFFNSKKACLKNLNTKTLQYNPLYFSLFSEPEVRWQRKDKSFLRKNLERFSRQKNTQLKQCLQLDWKLYPRATLQAMIQVKMKSHRQTADVYVRGVSTQSASCLASVFKSWKYVAFDGARSSIKATVSLRGVFTGTRLRTVGDFCTL